MHKHLRRLELTWIDSPLYFVTICTKDRRKILAADAVARILTEEWRLARDRSGWVVGRYVIMPDHVHFFCRPELEAKTLSRFVGAWKTWTSRRIPELLTPQPTAAATTQQVRITNGLWQREFFDHLLRSSESYTEKWNYVRENPVRGGLVTLTDDWPDAGELERLEA
jgi:REP element-mobilizing transposase RayT